mmetsp:Transcript_9454/g.29564  ORF Transcript_9454/g.29564 Transcript_9454/m.29564 type:complete len:227 (-) Transcript_9454:245-925(-)
MFVRVRVEGRTLAPAVSQSERQHTQAPVEPAAEHRLADVELHTELWRRRVVEPLDVRVGARVLPEEERVVKLAQRRAPAQRRGVGHGEGVGVGIVRAADLVQGIGHAVVWLGRLVEASLGSGGSRQLHQQPPARRGFRARDGALRGIAGRVQLKCPPGAVGGGRYEAQDLHDCLGEGKHLLEALLGRQHGPSSLQLEAGVGQKPAPMPPLAEHGRAKHVTQRGRSD